MAVEVEFITLGTASEKLDVLPQTLRLWTDQLEEYEVHYVMRNDRNERLYYDTDLEIFAYLRDLKKEHGRKTTTKDLAYMIYKLSTEDDMFTLRTKDEVPQIEPTNTHLDLLNQKDIKNLLESDRVRQFINIIVDNTTQNIRDELIKAMGLALHAMKEEVKQEIQESREKTDGFHEVIKRMEEDNRQWREEQRKSTEELRVLAMELKENSNKGFFSKLFGK